MYTFHKLGNLFILVQAVKYFVVIFEPRDKACLRVFPTRFDTNQAVLGIKDSIP